MKRNLIAVGILAAVEAIKIGCAGFVYLLIKEPLVMAAARERGYTGAYGGEWLLIIAAVALTYYGATKFFRYILFPKPRPTPDVEPRKQ